MVPPRNGAAGGERTSSDVNAFAGLLGLLVLSFYFMPDQAGRNLVLYLAALSAHAFMRFPEAWRAAFGHSGGWMLLLAVLPPCVSLIWSTSVSADTSKDLLIAAYCILAIYFGVAWVLRTRPRLAEQLPVLMLIAGNVAGAVAVARWLASLPGAEVMRLEGVWGIDNPVHASVLLLVATLPVLFQVLHRARHRLWLMGLAIPIAFVVLAGSRAAAASYVVILMAMTIGRSFRWAAGILVAFLTIGVAAVVVIGADALGEIWLSRGISFRDVVWSQVWDRYLDCNLLLGCGTATPLQITFGGVVGARAHSIFVAALYHQGVLGLGLLLLALGWLLWHGVRSRNAMAQVWSWMLAYVVLANTTSGDHVLVRATLFWPSFWLPVMVTAAMCRESSAQASP